MCQLSVTSQLQNVSSSTCDAGRGTGMMLNDASRGCWRGTVEGRVFSSLVLACFHFSLSPLYHRATSGVVWGYPVVHTFPWCSGLDPGQWPLHCSPPDLDWKLDPRTSTFSVVPLTRTDLSSLRRIFSAQGLLTNSRKPHENFLSSSGRQPHLLQWSLNTRSENKVLPSEFVPSLHILSHP